MSFWKRILTLGKAEASNLLSKLEDSTKLVKQSIFELEKEIDQVQKSFIEVKSIAVREQYAIEKLTQEATDWRKKATLLVTQASQGKIPEEKADDLAKQALGEAKKTDQQIALHTEEYTKQNAAVTSLEQQLDKMKEVLQQYRNELTALETRLKLAKVSQKIETQLGNFGENNTTHNLINKLHDRVEEEEALAFSMKSLQEQPKKLEVQIDNSLATNDDHDQLEQELSILKEKINS